MEDAKKRTTRSNNYCCVPQCNSYYSEGLSFHRFPNKGKMLQNEWKRLLKIDKEVTKYMQVCSKHFRKDDFKICLPTNQDLTSRRMLLKRGRVPSLCLPKTSCEAEHPEHNVRLATDKAASNHELSLHTSMVLEAVDEEMELSISNPLYEHLYHKTFKEKAIQANTFEHLTNTNIASEIITTNSELKKLTGIYNFDLLKFLVNGITSKFNDDKCTKEQQIILTMMRLKLDISFAALGIFFKMSASTAQVIFRSTINALVLFLKPLMRFPSRAEIQKNMPQSFERYCNTRIVLDCTEIAVQTHKCLKCRNRFYSSYKGRPTVKFLIGTAPSGLITYVSKPYGGSSSDTAVFNKENLLSKLDLGDAVMVDKCFLIDRECRNKNISLIRPPFLRNRKRLSEKEATETAAIARARVHMARAIKRIKLFKVFKSVVPLSILPFINDAMMIVVAVTNFSMPSLDR